MAIPTYDTTRLIFFTTHIPKLNLPIIYLPTYQLLLRCREANERILAKVSERERRESNPYFVLYYYEYNYVKLLRII